MDWNAYRYVPVVALILAAIWLSHRPGDVPLALKGICKMLGKAPPASAVKRNPVWKRLLAFLCVLLAFALCVVRFA